MQAISPILMVVNPVSGGGRARRTAEATAKYLRARGAHLTVQETQVAGDAERIAHEAALGERSRPRVIVACGGDGCVQEVANALASLGAKLGNDCPVLGLAPAGRCNDFARALGVSANPSAIGETLMQGRPQQIDLGRVNGRYFCTVATVGVDAEVSSFVERMRVPLKGTLAYLYGAVCVLARYRARRLRIEGDFGLIERPLFIASCANTASYGGAITIAPDAVPTDGELDVCIIEPVSRRRLLTLLPTVVRGRHGSEPEVQLLRTRRLTVDAAEPLPIWADGERVAVTPATIEVVPAAISVMLPIMRGAGDREGIQLQA